MHHVATIVTTNHIDKALVLHESLNTFAPTTMHVLVVDYKPKTLDQLKIFPDFHVYDMEEVISEPDQCIARIIANKYARTIDELRWSLKPIFISYLRKEHPTICYVDCDLCFYGDYQFIIDKLQTASVILTPHWRQISPFNINFMFNFKHGIYNAGFVGFGAGCEKMLTWWAEMCAIECTRSDKAYTYVDQRYLDLVPIYFDNVEVLKHYGCNVAGWNADSLARERVNSTTLICGMPIVFIHYSEITVTLIECGKDTHLFDYYNYYRIALHKMRKKLASLGLKDCLSQTIDTQII